MWWCGGDGREEEEEGGVGEGGRGGGLCDRRYLDGMDGWLKGEKNFQRECHQ